ncbi:PKD domain-containing protein [Chloroflexota bacterium]
MKRTIISLITVVMLVMMMLPADIAAARGGRGHGPTATNETIESLVADFVFDIPECPLCEGVTFTDRSSGGVPPYTYDWDFGDGSNSTEQNPAHRYADYGNYTVTLTVTDGASDVANKSKTVTLDSTPAVKNIEPDSDISLAGAVASPSAWPPTWTGLDTDENGNCNTHRNVFDTDEDGYALYYEVDSDYIYLRMETVTAPGWPGTGSQDVARYKWWFNTSGTAASVKGTSVYDAEFLLILEDRTDTDDVDGNKDQLGELTLMDDLGNIGFKARWNQGGSGAYITGIPDNGGSSSVWNRTLGTGTLGVGGPQGVMGADIGYRIHNAFTGGNFVDMYISRAALGNPTSLCIIWATDNQNPNMDQAPDCDRPDQVNCIMLGKDLGDAPDPAYPTLLANDGARHNVGDLYLGAAIDAELDGIPNSTATGDDNDNVDDEDGVAFTTALVRGQSANVTVTASAAGYLDAWLDFNDDGDWADAGEQIFADESLSAGDNYLSFPVPFSAVQTAGTFARFRFSSTGGLSYDGLADDGEVEDYMVAIEGCTLTVDLTGDTDFCEGSDTTIIANVTGGTPDYDYDWSDSTALGTANDGSYTATGSGMVKVTVTDDNGCTGSANVTVTALQGPTADFTSDVSSCCDPLTVQFTDQSTQGDNPVDTWFWDFGDGSNSTAQNPSHTYDDGTYTVTLTVTDSHGCSDTETKIDYITSNEGPTADFSANVTDCCDPLTVQFTDQSTQGDNPVDTWFWDFGDGDNSTAQNPSHTYDDGTYTVTLTVTDSHGCSDTETKIDYITSNEGPTADFSAIPTSGYAPLDVDFSDNSVAGDNTIVDWYWEFGDGDTSTDQNPSHTYGSVGTYTVTLTVTDEHGCSDEATTNVVVTVPVIPTTGGGGCPTTKYLTCDWEGNNTTEPLYSNDKLAVDLLGPSPDAIHNLFLERGTHAPVVDETTYYLIVVRELEDIPPLPEGLTAIVVFNITPADAVFNRDIFLTLGIDELPEDALNVTMAYYDDIDGVWETLEFEAGGPNGVAELTLSAPINHFSIYGVLAELEPTAPPQPAHFVPSGLTITPSVEKTVFVTKTGESVTITANIANDGGEEGTYDVVLKLNGQTVDTKTVPVGAGQTEQVSFTQSGLDYGQYDVEVAGLTDEFTTSRTITWWLIILIIVAIGLIIWGIVWGRRRRRQAQQEA